MPRVKSRYPFADALFEIFGFRAVLSLDWNEWPHGNQILEQMVADDMGVGFNGNS